MSFCRSARGEFWNVMVGKGFRLARNRRPWCVQSVATHRLANSPGVPIILHVATLFLRDQKWHSRHERLMISMCNR